MTKVGKEQEIHSQRSKTSIAFDGIHVQILTFEYGGQSGNKFPISEFRKTGYIYCSEY